MNKYNISKIVNGDLYNNLKYDNPKTFFERKFNKQLEALTIKYRKINCIKSTTLKTLFPAIFCFITIIRIKIQ